MFKSLPVQLVICVAIAFLIGNHLNLPTVQFFLSLSCIIKDVLMLALPLVIITYIASAILSLEQKAPLLIISIMLFVSWLFLLSQH